MEPTNGYEIGGRYYKIYKMPAVEGEGVTIQWDGRRRAMHNGLEVVPSRKMPWDNGFPTPMPYSSWEVKLIKVPSLNFLIAEPVKQVVLADDWVTDRVKRIVAARELETMSTEDYTLYLKHKVSLKAGLVSKEVVVNGTHYLAIESTIISEKLLPQLSAQVSKGLL